MKKIAAIILSLALMLGCAAGLAEAAEKETLGTLNVNGAFTVQGNIPEGYRSKITSEDSTSLNAMLVSGDETKPVVLISIAYNELWTGIERLNDVTDEDLAEIEASFQEEDEVTIEYRKTDLGTKLMVVTETLEGTDFVDVYTIYKGYELEFILIPGTAALTEENIQMLIDLITGIDFVDANGDEEIVAQMPEAGWVLDGVDGAIWQDDRATLEIFLEDVDNYKVQISWASSASETTEWVYACDYDAESDTLKARYVICDNVTYNDAGEENRTEVYEKDSSEAVFSLNEEGRVVLTNAGDDALEGKTFEYTGNLDSDVQ